MGSNTLESTIFSETDSNHEILKIDRVITEKPMKVGQYHRIWANTPLGHVCVEVIGWHTNIHFYEYRRFAHTETFPHSHTKPNNLAEKIWRSEERLDSVSSCSGRASPAVANSLLPLLIFYSLCRLLAVGVCVFCGDWCALFTVFLFVCFICIVNGDDAMGNNWKQIINYMLVIAVPGTVWTAAESLAVTYWRFAR